MTEPTTDRPAPPPPPRRILNPCDRCGDEVDHSLGVAQLIDVYCAKLCVQCMNEWERLCLFNEQVAALRAIDWRMNAMLAQAHGNGYSYGAELASLDQEKRELLRMLYLTAEQWVHGENR